MRNWYNNLSEEKKQEWSQRTKDQLANRTAEEWAIINRKNSEGLKRHWSTVSDEYKKKRIMPMLEAAWKSWDNLSPEEKRERATKWMKSKTEEELNQIMLGYSLRMKEYNESIPYEEKLRRVNHMNNYLKKLPEEERKEIARKAHEWISKMSIEESWEYYKQNLKSMILRKDFTSTEQEFINLLKINNLKNSWIPQYINEIADKNILLEYPNIRNPYHIWDFRIRLTEKDIYVDIDGSIHGMKNDDFITSNGFNVSEFMKSRDNRRKYQTDGLDAYAVQCFNDRIDKNTTVMNIKTGEVISFNNFINILFIESMSKTELRKILKHVDI